LFAPTNMVTPQDAKKCNPEKQTGHFNDYSTIYNHKACWIMQLTTFQPNLYVFHHSVNISVFKMCHQRKIGQKSIWMKVQIISVKYIFNFPVQQYNPFKGK
jgi:hypothetical protein